MSYMTLMLNYMCDYVELYINIIFYLGHRKVHYLFEDGREMVESYNMDTNVVVRRVWKKKSNFGTDVGCDVEVGDPESKFGQNLINSEQNTEIIIQESLSVVCYFLSFFIFFLNNSM